MPNNPLEEIQRLFSEGLFNSVAQVQHFVFRKQQHQPRTAGRKNEQLVSPANHTTSQAIKENLGRSTWTLLHTMAAQYPEKPNERQRKDVETLIDSLTRTYPCAQCSEHFQEIVRKKPPKADSAHELQQWMCEVHNIVNDSLDKPQFNCKYVDSRWKSCDESLEGACAIQPRSRTGSHG